MKKNLNIRKKRLFSGEFEGETAPPYKFFASIYDRMMDHVPYARWSEYLLRRATEGLGGPPRSLLDLACGTGTMLELLERRVPETRGMDGSPEMLEESQNRTKKTRFTRGNLEGPLPYRNDGYPWLICTHDSLNYLLTEKALQSHFREAFRILEPGGLYSLDLVSMHNILKHHDGQRAEFRMRPYKLFWCKRFDRNTSIMTSTLEFMESGRLISREMHRQRWYGAKKLREIAETAGLRLWRLEGNYEPRPFRESDTLMNFHFRKPAS